jgi:ceramide glucosyltransferase
LTHCLYRLTGSQELAGRWETFIVDADFWSQVLQHRSFGPLRYALGAAMAFRRSDLESIGGFEVLADHLADDHQLGRRITSLGRRTELCPIVVDSHLGPTNWPSAWRHQLRWATTIRVCQPIPHFFSILANGTVWSAAALAVATSPSMIAMAVTLLILRLIQGLALEARFNQRPIRWRDAWLPWMKDLLQVPVWFLALFQRHVLWRGHRYRVQRNGRLIALADRSPHGTPIPATRGSSASRSHA